MIKIRDLIAAEEAFEAASREFRKLNDNPAEWSAYESLTRDGKKELNILPGHLERLASVRAAAAAAEVQLLALRRAFIGKVECDHADR